MIFQATLSNKARPEYGQATIPFPIPDSEYDQTIELLEGLSIGSPTDQDCRVDFLDSKHPILNRLVTQNVNVDELDYLAKRPESFCTDEDARFQAMAFKFCLSDIKDFINLTFCCQQAIYSHTYGNFTDTGNAIGLEHWNEYWSDIWFMVAQAMSWYYEHGIILDVNSNREGFIEQAAEEFVAAMKLYHQTYGQSSWITNWDTIGTHSIIDSPDGGATGYSAYDYVSTGVNLVLDHPEYYHNYHLWIYEWDSTQPWKLAGQSGIPMQRLLIAVPDMDDDEDSLKMTVKKLEAGTNKPLPGVTFKIENADGSGDFSVTKTTGTDGTLTLTSETDNLSAGQYLITEAAVPEGYVAQTASQTVTVLPNSSAANTFTFYNEKNGPGNGDGSIRKVSCRRRSHWICSAANR